MKTGKCKPNFQCLHNNDTASIKSSVMCMPSRSLDSVHIPLVGACVLI